MIIFSKGIKKLSNLQILVASNSDTKAVLGWGNKPNTAKPRAYAIKHEVLLYWWIREAIQRFCKHIKISFIF